MCFPPPSILGPLSLLSNRILTPVSLISVSLLWVCHTARYFSERSTLRLGHDLLQTCTQVGEENWAMARGTQGAAPLLHSTRLPASSPCPLHIFRAPLPHPGPAHHSGRETRECQDPQPHAAGSKQHSVSTSPDPTFQLCSFLNWWHLPRTTCTRVHSPPLWRPPLLPPFLTSLRSVPCRPGPTTSSEPPV